VNPVLYVVIIADSDQTVCYKLRLFSATLCVYVKIKKVLIFETKLRKKIDGFEQNCGSFHLPQSVVYNAFSVLGIPTGDTQNTRDLGTGVPKTRGYPNHCDTGMLRDIVIVLVAVRRTCPRSMPIHAASCVDHEKKDTWFYISLCMRLDLFLSLW